MLVKTEKKTSNEIRFQFKREKKNKVKLRRRNKMKFHPPI